MSNKERDEAGVIQRVLDRRLSQVEAARILGIRTRQDRRLCRRVEERGVGCPGHGFHRMPSNRRSTADIRARILAVVREHYADLGPTLAHGNLSELNDLHMSVETLRRGLMAKGGLDGGGSGGLQAPRWRGLVRSARATDLVTRC